jgi:hypothetical protein
MQTMVGEDRDMVGNRGMVEEDSLSPETTRRII